MNLRKRQVPHIEGNFATIITIRIAQQSAVSELERVQNTYKKLFPSAQPLNLKNVDNAILGPHISLSFTQYLKSHLLEPFIKSIENILIKHQRFPIRISTSPLYHFPVQGLDQKELELQEAVESPIKRHKPCQENGKNNKEAFGVLEVDSRTMDISIGPLLKDVNRVIEEFGGIPLPKSSTAITEDNGTNAEDICFLVTAITIRIGKCHVNIRLESSNKTYNQWPLERILSLQSSGGDPPPQDSDEESSEEE